MKTLWRGIDAILKNLSGCASGEKCAASVKSSIRVRHNLNRSWAGYLRWEGCTFQLQKAGTQGRVFCFFFGMKHPDDPRSDFQQPPDQARFILIRCQRSGKWMTQNVMTA